MTMPTKKKIHVTKAKSALNKPCPTTATMSTKGLNMFADLNEHIVKNGGKFSVSNLNILRA
jgi:hypothetical protein